MIESRTARDFTLVASLFIAGIVDAAEAPPANTPKDLDDLGQDPGAGCVETVAAESVTNLSIRGFLISLRALAIISKC